MIRQYTMLGQVILGLSFGLAQPVFSQTAHSAGNARSTALASTHLPPSSVIDVETSLPATGEMPLYKAQAWKKSADLIIGRIPHDQLGSMKNKAQSVANLLRDCFAAGPFTPTWHGEYFAARPSTTSTVSGDCAIFGGSPANPPHFGIQCTFRPSEATSTPTDPAAELLLLSNDLSPLLGHLSFGHEEFLTIGATLSQREGSLRFELPAGPSSLAATFWLVTADSSRQPYLPVSRREFLLEAGTQLMGDSAAIANEWHQQFTVRSASEQEAEKESQLQHLRSLYTGTDLEAHTRIYLQSYISDEAYLRQQIDKATGLQREALHIVDNLLHADAGELNRPAYLSSQPGAEAFPPTGNDPRGLAAALMAFPGFADNLPGAVLLVRTNPAFFDTALPEEKPQFFLLGWRFDPANTLAVSLDSQLRENFAPVPFREILGK